MGSGIAHEDPGGVKVEDQEPQARAGQRARHFECREILEAGGRQHQGHGDDKDHPCGKTVDPVQKVDGVLHSEQPEDGDWNRQPVELHDEISRQPKRRDLESEHQDRYDRHQELKPELDGGPDLPAIVGDEQKSRQASDDEDADGVLVVGQEVQQSGGKAEVEGDAAKNGGWLRVGMALARHGHHPDPPRRPDHQGHRHRAHGEGNQKRPQPRQQMVAQIYKCIAADEVSHRLSRKRTEGGICGRGLAPAHAPSRARRDRRSSR